MLWLGDAPETIPTSLPHLMLAQVFDALNYESDHQAEINTYLERNCISDPLKDSMVRNNE